MAKRSILLILSETEGILRRQLKEILAHHGFEVFESLDKRAALKTFATRTINLVITGSAVEDSKDSLDAVHEVRSWDAHVPVILIAKKGCEDLVVSALKLGVSDCFRQPVSPEEVVASVLKHLAFRGLYARHHPSKIDLLCESNAAGNEATSLSRDGEPFQTPPGPLPSSPLNLLGVNPRIEEVRERIAYAARSGLNVLITGESGTGKELVARAVHRLSPRGEKPLVIINCANVPGDLWESLFFGHSRGAFTGANDDRDGLLEEANGSYLFLDELEAMSAEQQPRFLRVIEDGEVRPLGSLIVRKASVRFITATNLDPEQLVIAGKLRQDLFYRLRGFEIRLPPLRDHPEDISVLAAHFLDGSGVRLSKDALEALQAQTWPGNVREFRNVLLAARAVAETSRKRMITLHHLVVGQGGLAPSTTALKESGFFVSGTLKEIEEQVITRTLRETKGNRSEAAHRLGIERKTLWARLKQFERNRQRNAR